MATIPVGGQDRAVSIGRVLQRGFGTIGSNPLVVLGIAFIFGALPNLLLSYGARQMRPSLTTSYGVSAVVIIAIASVLFAIIFALLTQGALVRATVAHSNGERATFADSITAGLRVILPLFLLSIIIGIAVSLGFILLIVPGVILYLMWSVASPALVEERFGAMSALDRSSYLTKGARWKILGVQLIILALNYAVGAALGVVALAIFGGTQALTAAATQGMPLWYLAISAVVQTGLSAVWATVQSSLYIELRDWKDGPQSDHLADVFA